MKSSIIAAIAGALFCPGAFALEPPALVPQPQSLVLHGGTMPLTAATRIVCLDVALQPLARVLSGEIELVTGLTLVPANGGARPGDIALMIDHSFTGEAYAVEVGDTATVRAGNHHALAFGTVTLLQAIGVDGGVASLPRLSIRDEPAYPYRGAMIDLARKYHSPGGIRQVIELCRLYKIRFLHLHLSDDQLFMFPSTRFPQVGKGNREFSRFEPPSAPRTDPYTIADLRDLEAYAQERGVHLVPEIDLPGHSGRLIGDAREMFGFPGNGNTVHIASPKARDAVASLLNEVIDVFQGSPYVHIGADEVGLGGLDKTPEWEEAQKTPGVKSTHDAYCQFVNFLVDTVRNRGKRAIVWEEAWNPDGPFPLPKDAIVMSWSHGRDPARIVAAGYEVVNATWTPLYIVRDNRKSPEFLFRWQVLEFGREGSETYTVLEPTPLVLGAQMCSWENSEAIEIQSLRRRLAIVAEKTWNPTAGADFAAFERRQAHTDGILERLVHPVTIRIAAGTLLDGEQTFAAPLAVELVKRDDSPHAIRYTLDNSLPGPHWKPYTGPITIDATAYLRAGLFDDAGGQQGDLVGSWFRLIK